MLTDAEISKAYSTYLKRIGKKSQAMSRAHFTEMHYGKYLPPQDRTEAIHQELRGKKGRGASWKEIYSMTDSDYRGS
jgi:hypothetical protein